MGPISLSRMIPKFEIKKESTLAIEFLVYREGHECRKGIARFNAVSTMPAFLFFLSIQS